MRGWFVLNWNEGLEARKALKIRGDCKRTPEKLYQLHERLEKAVSCKLLAASKHKPTLNMMSCIACS
jgi:hypothetical protein